MQVRCFLINNNKFNKIKKIIDCFLSIVTPNPENQKKQRIFIFFIIIRIESYPFVYLTQLLTYKMACLKRKLSIEPDACALHKELDEVSCSVCMDHPHNAVLLLCSSHDKGCRSYICDTSYRHSNCLDRLKTLHSSESSSDPTPIANLALRASNERDRSSSHHVSENRVYVGGGSDSMKCPLCRGTVLGWKVVEEVRSYLDLKNRSCSRESCSFAGNYQDLRRHARRIHPTTRPSDTDPTRERAWRRLENQREYGDIVSAVRSAMPGAVVVGDYVIENGNRLAGNESSSNSDLWTTLVLFQMIGSLDNNGGSSGSGSGHGGGSRSHRSRAWRSHRRYTDRRYLWGENLLGVHDNNNNNNHEALRLQIETEDELNRVPRRGRRFGRPRSNGDHQR